MNCHAFDSIFLLMTFLQTSASAFMQFTDNLRYCLTQDGAQLIYLQFVWKKKRNCF